MEKKDQLSRKNALSELKRNRSTGSYQHNAANKESDGEYDINEEDDDLEDFIVEDTQSRPYARSISSFFNPKKQPNNNNNTKINSASDFTGAKSGLLEKDDYFKNLLCKLDEDVESDSSSSSSHNETDNLKSIPMGSLVGATSELDKMALCTSDPTSGGHIAVDLTSEVMDIDWEDIPDSLKAPSGNPAASIFKSKGATPMPEPDKTPITPPLIVSSIFTMAGNVEKLLNEQGDLILYWFDAFERAQSGTVYLFGKVRESRTSAEFTSCCVAVTGLLRSVYFLPKPGISLMELSEEIRGICLKFHITPVSLERVEKKYAFFDQAAKPVPRKAEWILLKYLYSEPSLPLALNGNTFSHVMGIGTSALESLIIGRHLMGPAWISLKPTLIAKKSVSWAKVEVECANPESIVHLLEQPPSPPLTCLSINVQTSKNREIVLISGVIYQEVEDNGGKTRDVTIAPSIFSVMRDPSGVGFSAKFSSSLQASVVEKGCKLEVARNERALLSYFIAILQRNDPDVILCHSLFSSDLGLLLGRMRACKVDFWSRLGRLNWSQWPKGVQAERSILSGRLPVDTTIMSKELVRDKNFSLSSLSDNVLGRKHEPVALPEDLDNIEADPMRISRFIKSSHVECEIQMLLSQKLSFLSLTRQLSNIAGNLWVRTLQGARAERNEFLFLHEFSALNYICPDPRRTTKPQQQPAEVEDEEKNNSESEGEGNTTAAHNTSSKSNTSYVGGLVLDPKRGFYDEIVLLLDFNSLYPSIIQEYAICFVDEKDEGESIVLPRILGNLVSRRRQVKALMKSASGTEYSILNIRQQALKLTANSIYGCLGFSASRFYAKPLAMTITGHGRRILQDTVNLAQGIGLRVIYGDTDSIMVAAGTKDLEEAKEIAEKLKRAVNGKYKLLEIELDGVFRKLLLLRKKKYASLSVEGKLETKGLDMVRRDWCSLSAELSEEILKMIFSDDIAAQDLATGIISYLQIKLSSLEGIPPVKFLINKSLTKEPEAYADPKNQPHVMVALHMKQQGKPVHAHDTISFLIVSHNGLNSGLLSERAVSLAEFLKGGEEGMKIDYEWYLSQQIFPPIARLTEFVPHLDHLKLAKALGN
jgi:DNA polymerase alpha subunit A